VDVIARRGLARGLTAALEIQHQSPQALVFRGGECVAHGSHGQLTRDWFDGRV
jgi:bacillithiol system protein YtxJ